MSLWAHGLKRGIVLADMGRVHVVLLKGTWIETLSRWSMTHRATSRLLRRVDGNKKSDMRDLKRKRTCLLKGKSFFAPDEGRMPYGTGRNGMYRRQDNFCEP